MAWACGGTREAPLAGPSRAVATPPAAEGFLRAGSLRAGTRLTLVPNLPGVALDDLPLATRRDVEVLACDGKRLKLRWTGRVRLEKPESARRREEWVRSYAHAPGASKLPPGEYEEKEVGGTLEFPDFGTARALLLPGLWPEGRAVVKGSSAIWLSGPVRDELRKAGEARLLLLPEGPLLSDPAGSLLQRAALVARANRKSGAGPDPERWRAGVPGAVSLRVGGRDGTVAAFEGSNWFGRYEVLADETNPLVLSVLPEPPPSVFLDLFAPTKVLETLLGYRVASLDGPE